MRPLGTYSFLPWLRSGLAGQITAADHDAGVHGRATVRVELEISGEPREGSTTLTAPVERDVALYGPGDVVGIDARAIVRCEPRDWITNFEPNYLPHVEFYDEDFPWRYTPAAPDASQLKLRPWIALVALEDGVEFRGPFTRPGAPLSFVEVTNADKLPDANDLWAWAHVHVNTTLAASDGEFVSTDMPAVIGRLQAALAANRDLAYSRVVCPRRLKENTAYRAFVVPVFETGRLGGLGLDPGQAPSATTSAWAAYDGKLDASALPVYHQWYFRTGGRGDFEYLVRLLKPGVADKRVGVRDMDVRRPGSNLPGIDDEDLGGILKLGGALRFPRDAYTPQERAAFDRFDKWARRPPAPRDYPQPFQQKLAAFVSLPDDYAQTTAAAANAAADLGLEVEGHPDPLITAPLYGRWHALTQRLLVQRDGNSLDPNDNWVHELNLDPRHRVAAGFGTRVVQTNQETYMQAAWEQIGDVLAANRKIRLAQLAKFAAASMYARALRDARVPERVLALTAPAHAHVVATGATVRHRLGSSRVAPALTSVAMRRVVRPGGRLVRHLPFNAAVTPRNLLGRVDAGAVSAAPPKVTPPGVVTVDEIGDATRPPAPPKPWIVRLLPWLARLVLWLVGVLTMLAGLARRVGLRRVAAGLLAAAAWLQRAVGIAPVAPWVGESETDVEALPHSPDFVISEPGAGVTAGLGERDSVQAQRFKTALGDWYALYRASRATGDEAPLAQLGVDAVAKRTVHALDPQVTIPRRTLHTITLPPHIRADLVEDFGEVMAYPVIDEPMYEPLRRISDELFLPNLNLLKPNSISLLETNQKFIEAYLVGINHEIARELLWREYPTDQRGTPFRQFWDARSALNKDHLSPEAFRESLRDIPELHRWPRRSALGDHDNRDRPGENEEEAVLVIRGELLKKYPNAVIYAQLAQWQRRPDGSIDVTRERDLVKLTEAEELDPPPTKVLTPLYEARVAPDITFFGFDLTIPEARGGRGTPGDEEPGWFFCIKERPGEPRFGFDIDKSPSIHTVNDLAWDDAKPPGEPGEHLRGTALGSIALAPLGPDDAEKTEQRADDLKVVGAPVSAARWAYILYQAPVIVAVHAAEMLPAP